MFGIGIAMSPTENYSDERDERKRYEQEAKEFYEFYDAYEKALSDYLK